MCAASSPEKLRADATVRFNAAVGALIGCIERKSTSEDDVANLDRLRRQIAALKATMGEEAVVERAAPILLQFEGVITSPDAAVREQFMRTFDVQGEVSRQRAKGVHVPDGGFVLKLADIVRAHFAGLSAADRDALHKKVVQLLVHAIEYKMAS